MASIAGTWNGRLFGTNTGNVAATFSVEDQAVSGEIRFLDDLFGPVVYTMEGSWDGQLLDLKGTGVPSNPEVIVGEVLVQGAIGVDGRLLGRWTSSLGTGGEFVLHPGATQGSEAHRAERAPPPEELHILQERLGAVRLYKADVAALCELILFDLNSDRLAVTFHNGATNSVLWSDIFLDTVALDDIRFLKLSINDPAPGGTSRLVIVECGSLYNEITVQGESQVWVAGKARVLREFLAKRQSFLITRFKLWNVNLITLMFFAMVVIMPSFEPLWARAAFACVIAAVVGLVGLLNASLIPASVTSMGTRKPSLLRFWPQWVSWLAGILSALIILKAGTWIEASSKPAPPPASRPEAAVSSNVAVPDQGR